MHIEALVEGKKKEKKTDLGWINMFKLYTHACILCRTSPVHTAYPIPCTRMA